MTISMLYFGRLLIKENNVDIIIEDLEPKVQIKINLKSIQDLYTLYGFPLEQCVGLVLDQVKKELIRKIENCPTARENIPDQSPCVYSKRKDVADDSVMAADIHPNLLGDIIPISRPGFIDLGGKQRACHQIEFVYVERSTQRFDENNYPLIAAAIARARQNNFKYLFRIHSFKETNEKDGITSTRSVYMITGCE
jgi:hypothetical protein